MATNTVGIDKEVEVNRKENLRDHRLYWIGRRTQDIILSGGVVTGHAGYGYCNCCGRSVCGSCL